MILIIYNLFVFNLYISSDSVGVTVVDIFTLHVDF